MSTDALVRRVWAPTSRLRGDALFWTSVMILAGFVLMVVAAPLLAPYDPEAPNLNATLTTPSPAHWLGTDSTGRDTLSRLVFGARTSLVGPLGVVAVSTSAGVLLGLVAAWRGGLVDAVISRTLDLMFAFPALLVAIIVVAISGPGLTGPVIAMGVAYTPYVARLVRSAASSEQAKPYVAAYRIQGFSAWTIMVRHLLPNIGSVVLAQSTLNFGYAMLDLAALSFLGFGIQPPTSDWGSDLHLALIAILSGSSMSALAPGVCIVLTVVGFNVVGESFADRLSRRKI